MKILKIGAAVLVLVLLAAGGGAGGYFWRQYRQSEADKAERLELQQKTEESSAAGESFLRNMKAIPLAEEYWAISKKAMQEKELERSNLYFTKAIAEDAKQAESWAKELSAMIPPENMTGIAFAKDIWEKYQVVEAADIYLRYLNKLAHRATEKGFLQAIIAKQEEKKAEVPAEWQSRLDEIKKEEEKEEQARKAKEDAKKQKESERNKMISDIVSAHTPLQEKDAEFRKSFEHLGTPTHAWNRYLTFDDGTEYMVEVRAYESEVDGRSVSKNFLLIYNQQGYITALHQLYEGNNRAWMHDNDDVIISEMPQDFVEKLEEEALSYLEYGELAYYYTVLNRNPKAKYYIRISAGYDGTDASLIEYHELNSSGFVSKPFFEAGS